MRPAPHASRPTGRRRARHAVILARLAALAAGVSVGLTGAACRGGGEGHSAGVGTSPPIAQGRTLEQRGPFVRLPGGTFVMGTPPETPNLSPLAREHGLAQGEQPAHAVALEPFWIARHEVTVAEFAAFVKATGYRTESEQLGWSGVFDTQTGAWTKMNDADWRRPEGPAAPLADPATSREPVTQVTWNDAQAYAKWAGGRLPTEAEWEYAARGGLVSEPYVWGRKARPDDARPEARSSANEPANGPANGPASGPVSGPVSGTASGPASGPAKGPANGAANWPANWPANWWQGPFPERNTEEDGYLRRAPVGAFARNGYGLHDMAGNVWEWCADWFDRAYYAASPRENPTGPDTGTERVMRGGSWMCADNVCANYRPAARSSATPDTGLNNVGFRLARDWPPAS